jgi:hypothetical protein
MQRCVVDRHHSLEVHRYDYLLLKEDDALFHVLRAIDMLNTLELWAIVNSKIKNRNRIKNSSVGGRRGQDGKGQIQYAKGI